MRANVSTAATIERQQELQLLSAVLDGDRRATRSFVDRYSCTIEMCVRKVLRGSDRTTDEDVRDMVGDVWLSLLEDDKRPLRRFDPGREVRVSTWIGLLARNKAIDRLRGRQERTVSLDQSAEDAEPPADAPLPSDEIEQREERLIASRALDDLDSSDREFLEAWYLAGRQPEDLAREFGISVGTVYTRRFKIQSKLARSIHRLCRPARRRSTPPTIH